MRCPGLLALGAVLLASPALGQPSTMTPAEAYAEIVKSGELRQVKIEGDLDVAKFMPPSGVKQIVMQAVRVDGRLHSSAGGPPIALWIVGDSNLRDVDVRESRWTAPLVIENSTIAGRALFDGAQFDAQFVLHATTMPANAQFRRTRFAGATEITASRFVASPDLAASTNFSDARFAAQARFDSSDFGRGVRFNSSRFDADATFLNLKASGLASFRNVFFGGDAEFRFCQLGEVDFGDAEQMSVFARLADFRGCRMQSLRLDFVDGRGDVLLVNVKVEPGDLSLREASLRGSRNDFSGLRVGGKLDLKDAQIANLQLRWQEVKPALMRGEPDSDTLRALQRRLEELRKEDEAREASAVLRERVITEQLADPATVTGHKAMLQIERLVWGDATGYGTRLDRILGIALLCWLVLTLPLLLMRMRIARFATAGDKISPLHQPLAADTLEPPTMSGATAAMQALVYAFGLMFMVPDLRLRPVEPVPESARWYLLFMRCVGLALIALTALTLTKVSPVLQAIFGKIVG